MALFIITDNHQFTAIQLPLTNHNLKEITMISRTTLITLLLYVTTTAGAFQNEPDGFRGIKWETPISDNANEMTLAEGDGLQKFYKRKNDKMTIGDAKLTDVHYVYWSNKFSGAMLRSKGTIEKSAMILAMQTTFGEGQKPNQYMDKYYWTGATTSISLTCNSLNSDCTVFIRSVKITQEANDHDKNSAKKAVGDF